MVQFGNLENNRTKGVEIIFLVNTKQNCYVVILLTIIKANHISALLVQVCVASRVPRLREDFTFRVCSRQWRLNKPGKLPDFVALATFIRDIPDRATPILTPTVISTAPEFRILNT